MTYYKILVNGESCCGGTQKWDLPRKDGRKWIPGAWLEVEGPLEMCSRGLHVTTKPYAWYKWGCDCFQAEIDAAIDQRDDKILCRKARLIKLVPHPKWWMDAIRFVDSIKSVPFFKPDGKPQKSWHLFMADSWDAARAAAGAAVRATAGDAAWDAARDVVARAAAWAAAGAAAWDAARDVARAAAGAAVRAAAGDAAWDAAWDAALYLTTVYICAELPLDKRHIHHAKDRWRVWQKGYGLLCDANGKLYVYAKQ